MNYSMTVSSFIAVHPCNLRSIVSINRLFNFCSTHSFTYVYKYLRYIPFDYASHFILACINPNYTKVFFFRTIVYLKYFVLKQNTSATIMNLIIQNNLLYCIKFQNKICFNQSNPHMISHLVICDGM